MLYHYMLFIKLGAKSVELCLYLLLDISQITSWEFCIENHDEYLLRTLFSPQVLDSVLLFN